MPRHGGFRGDAGDGGGDGVDEEPRVVVHLPAFRAAASALTSRDIRPWLARPSARGRERERQRETERGLRTLMSSRTQRLRRRRAPSSSDSSPSRPSAASQASRSVSRARGSTPPAERRRASSAHAQSATRRSAPKQRLSDASFTGWLLSPRFSLARCPRLSCQHGSCTRTRTPTHTLSHESSPPAGGGREGRRGGKREIKHGQRPTYVAQHHLGVGRKPHVRLDGVGAGPQRAAERGHGVLGEARPVAAVRNRLRHQQRVAEPRRRRRARPRGRFPLRVVSSSCCSSSLSSDTPRSSLGRGLCAT